MRVAPEAGQDGLMPEFSLQLLGELERHHLVPRTPLKPLRRTLCFRLSSHSPVNSRDPSTCPIDAALF
jgi:hypothetical protein